MKATLPFALFLLAVCDAAPADVQVGSTRADVIKEWGEPQRTMRLGPVEEFVYETGTRVGFQDGKVTRIRNKEAMKNRSAKAPSAVPSTGAPASAAAPAAVSATGKGPLPDTPATFTGIPKAAIVTDPAYRPKGTAGGGSDGKTLGIDGKPMAPQDLYYNDCHAFMERLSLGIARIVPEDQRSRLASLQSVFSAPDEARRLSAIESHKRSYQTVPDKDPWARFAQARARMITAGQDYELARDRVNRGEDLRVKDRIDLDAAPSEAGKQNRAKMKQAIAELQRWRTVLETEFAHLYDAGRKEQETEHAKAAASEVFATTQGENIRLFTYQTFERTPMLEGLAEAGEGRTLVNAKPIIIPAGVRVQVKERKTMAAPAYGARPAKQLDVSKIHIQAEGMVQHDGKALPKMTFEGWVLSRHLQPAQ